MNLPNYRCHKTVRAVKILSMGMIGDKPAVIPDADMEPFTVSEDFVERLKSIPVVTGGYFVKYDDGYESWSPAEVFEKGYSLIQ